MNLTPSTPLLFVQTVKLLRVGLVARTKWFHVGKVHAREAPPCPLRLGAQKGPWASTGGVCQSRVKKCLQTFLVKI